MANDLYDELRDTIQWINIRTILMTHLSESANTGDRSAQDQLNFLVQYWSYPVPMQKQLADAHQRGYQLAGVCSALLELLEQRGERLPYLREQLTKLGVEMPQSITRSRTITAERCPNCLDSVVYPNEHLDKANHYVCKKAQ